MDVDGAAVAVVFEAPHLVQQLVAGVDPVGVRGEAVQQFQLLRGSFHHLALDPQLVAVHVEAEVVELDDALGALGLGRGDGAAAQHRLDAGHDLFGVEGLDHVVVCAQLEAQHLIEGLALGRQHHDRGVAQLADAAADLEAVHPGHHDVQQHHVGLELVELFKALFAVVGRRDLIALLGQVEPQQLADVGIVVHNEYLFVCHVSVPPLSSPKPAPAGRWPQF